MSIPSVSLCCSISQLKALGNIGAFHGKGSKNYCSTSGWDATQSAAQDTRLLEQLQSGVTISLT